MAKRINQVHQGDCIKGMRALDPGSIDLVFADPPFNIGYEYDSYDDRRAADEYLDWSRQWIAAARDALRPTGTFWLAIGDEFAAELKLAAQDLGFTCRSWVIWYYTFGVNCLRGFSRSHTHLFHFVRDPDHFTFNADHPGIRVLSARQLVYRDARANPRGRLPDNTWILRPQDAPASFAPEDDTWYFARVAGTFNERQGFHGCQMPEQLLGRVIRVSSNPRDIVLDPFAGSGTTLAVAHKLGRQWVGFELSAAYVRRIKERLNSAHPGDPLDGPENALDSAPPTRSGRRKLKLRAGKVLPHAESATEEAIVAAYETFADRCSVDQLLCDPDLAAEFVDCCRSAKLPGSPYVWKRVLLRLRKRKRLPKSARRGKKGATLQSNTDPYAAAAEIATRLLEVDFGFTVDEIICCPDAVEVFERTAAEFAPGYSSFEYRWAALSMRKRARWSRQQADLWRELGLELTLSPRRSLTVAGEAPAESGVYVLYSDNQVLYVGETGNLRSRLEEAAVNDAWKQLGASQCSWQPVEPARRVGARAILVDELKPLLNSRHVGAASAAPATDPAPV